MIALVVLMIAAIALVRSTDTAEMISGNLSIKRDMTHESELAMSAALANFGATTSNLYLEGSRWGAVAAANYSPVTLPSTSNTRGIPDAIYNASTAGETPATNNITYRYVIDRLCPLTGAPNPLNPSNECVTDASAAGQGIDVHNPGGNAGNNLAGQAGNVVYRISARLTDPRGTQSFFQTTFESLGN